MALCYHGVILAGALTHTHTHRVKASWKVAHTHTQAGECICMRWCRVSVFVAISTGLLLAARVITCAAEIFTEIYICTYICAYLFFLSLFLITVIKPTQHSEWYQHSSRNFVSKCVCVCVCAAAVARWCCEPAQFFHNTSFVFAFSIAPRLFWFFCFLLLIRHVLVMPFFIWLRLKVAIHFFTMTL